MYDVDGLGRRRFLVLGWMIDRRWGERECVSAIYGELGNFFGTDGSIPVA